MPATGWLWSMRTIGKVELGRRGALDEVDVHEGAEEAYENRQHHDADDRHHEPSTPSRHARTIMTWLPGDPL